MYQQTENEQRESYWKDLYYEEKAKNEAMRSRAEALRRKAETPLIVGAFFIVPGIPVIPHWVSCVALIAAFCWAATLIENGLRDLENNR